MLGLFRAHRESARWAAPAGAATGVALLVVVAAASFGPYLLLGPGHFVDDWFALRNVVTDGWWAAAGEAQWRTRPGVGVVYAVIFGLIGARPAVHAALGALLLLVTAVLLWRVLLRFVPPRVALATSAAWLVAPNHTSLEAWPSALNIAFALLLVVAGIERLTRAPLELRTQVGSAGLFGASMLCYEATVPLAAVAIGTLAWVHRSARRAVARLVAIHAAVLGAAGLWMLANWNPAKSGLDVWIDPVQVVNGNMTTGVVGEHVGAVLLGGTIVVISVVMAYLRARDGSEQATEWYERMVLGGWIVVVTGALPFVRYFYSPVGLGDRVTVVSGIGGVAVVVGVLGWIGARNVVLAAALGAAVLAGATGTRASLVADYATAADDGARVLAAVERRWPTPPEEPVVFGPYPVMKRNVVTFIDADWPLQWLYGTRQVSAGFTTTTEAFSRVPPDRRIDLLELSDLEAVDRIPAAP